MAQSIKGHCTATPVRKERKSLRTPVSALDRKVAHAVSAIEGLLEVDSEAMRVAVLQSARAMRVLRLFFDRIKPPPRQSAVGTGRAVERAPSPLDYRKIAAGRQILVDSGAVLTSRELQARLTITRQALSKAVAANRLFALDVAGSTYYPAFYADPGLDRRCIEKVARRLGDLPGWSKFGFFTTPKLSLGRRTPVVSPVVV